MDNKIKCIGILGGMGPAAGVFTAQRIIDYSQKIYHAVQDTEYPPIILHNIPLTEFDETGIIKSEKAKTQLIRGVKNLQLVGSEIIIIACNTVHIYYKALVDAVNVPIVNMVEEVCKFLQLKDFKRVGILSSEYSRKQNLYKLKLAKFYITNLEINYNEQQLLNGSILEIMGGHLLSKNQNEINKLMIKLQKRGAQAIVLACTEFPLAIRQNRLKIPIISAIDVTVQKALTLAYNY